MLGTVYGCLHPLPAPCGDMNWGWCNSLARRCLGRDCGITSVTAVTQASQGVSSHHILISLSLEIVNTLLSASPGIPAKGFSSKQGDHIQLPPLPGGEWLGVEELGPLVSSPFGFQLSLLRCHPSMFPYICLSINPSIFSPPISF